MRFTRRKITRWLLSAPVAATAAGALGIVPGGRGGAAADEASAPSYEGPTPLARFLSKRDPDLTGAEKHRVRKEITQLEDALRTIRAHPLGNDVPPSGVFRALRSKSRS